MLQRPLKELVGVSTRTVRRWRKWWLSRYCSRERSATMYKNRPDDLYSAIRRLDEEMAEEARKRGCSCGGKLHQANYPRKPRGAPEEGLSALSQRLSFCCAREGCRRRMTPPSALFLGRKVYLGAIVVLVSVLRQGPSRARLSRLQEVVEVSDRTVRRWRKWWLETFVDSAFWRGARGLLRRPPEESRLPLSLLDAFVAAGVELRLVFLLRFISPLGSSSAAAGHVF